MNRRPRVSMIWAMDQNRVIGLRNKIPWRLPADMAYFKRTTTGHSVVMGRKTYESIGKPLPNRTNIVLTRDPHYRAEGCRIVHSPQEAIAAAEGDELFVMGGAEVYALFFPYADRLLSTLIDAKFEGDSFFPDYDPSEWVETARIPGMVDDKNVYPHTFLVYERKQNP